MFVFKLQYQYNMQRRAPICESQKFYITSTHVPVLAMVYRKKRSVHVLNSPEQGPYIRIFVLMVMAFLPIQRDPCAMSARTNVSRIDLSLRVMIANLWYAYTSLLIYQSCTYLRMKCSCA